MFHFDSIYETIPYLLGGISVTLKYTFVSLILGLIGGTFLSLLKLSRFKVLAAFAVGYTSVFRGTPLLLQLTLIYYGLPQLFLMNIGIFEAGVLAFSLNSAAYTSEIIKAGIQSVDKGQFEAMLALGIPYSKGMKDIILPQAIKTILPALVNEMINLLKESSIISVIGEADLLRRAHLVSAEKYLFFEPLMIIGCVYYILVMGLSLLSKLLEKKLA